MVEFWRTDGRSVVEIDFSPALLGSIATLGLVVDEVAAFPKTAKTFLLEGMTDLGFVRSIMFHVNP